MTTISTIRERLRKPSVQKNKKLSIGLARKAVKITERSDLTEWFMSRYTLAQFLLRRANGADFNSAIKLMLIVRKRISRNEHPKMWADTSLILARAYECKRNGDLKSAIAEYLSAMRFYSKDSYPDLWAMIKYHLATIYSLCEQGRRLDNIDEAIKNYKDALEVLSAEKNSEAHKDIQDALAELEREQKATILVNGK